MPEITFEHIQSWLKIAVEVGLLALLLYLAMQYVRGTRAVTILAGITMLGLTLFGLAKLFDLGVIRWLVTNLWAVLGLIALVVFQPEVRGALSELGRRPSLLGARRDEAVSAALISTLLDATYFLADRRIGALIAVEQSIGLRSYAVTGTPVGAMVSSKLLSTIFFPNTPLHDGGVILCRDQLVAAGCIFPLSQNPDLGKTLGTRHRAGVGLSEETDAVVIIVSEEAGAVSLARGGRLTRGVSRERLKRHLTNYLVKRRRGRRGGLLGALGAAPPEAEAAASTAGEG